MQNDAFDDIFNGLGDLEYNPTGGLDSGVLSADDLTAGIFSSSTSCSSTASNVAPSVHGREQHQQQQQRHLDAMTSSGSSTMQPVMDAIRNTAPPPPPPLQSADIAASGGDSEGGHASSMHTGNGGQHVPIDFDICDLICEQVISAGRTPLSSTHSGDDVSMEPLVSDVAGFLNSIGPPSGTVGGSNSNNFVTNTCTNNANQVNNNNNSVNLNFEPASVTTVSIGGDVCDVLDGDEADMMLTTFGGVPCWETAGTL